uniref:class I tRNA ligase family protein n=1 Tax=Vallitalea guaymasensis TaxID=1185412 RepID=UPI002729E3E8
NGPEKRDTDFSFRELINRHNGELLGTYGNFINRTIVFIEKYFNNKIPNGSIDENIEAQLKSIYKTTGENIEIGNLRAGLEEIFNLLRNANKYFDTKKPWETRTTDQKDCENTIYNCIQIIANTAVLLEPFIPFSSNKVIKWLGINDTWDFKLIESGKSINSIDKLFERIDKKIIHEELEKLNIKDIN